ncbi:MAG: HNH endonuclease [Actinobacteria bacterium]|nr:HNH endonuclease [Actinomycetota bacterium]
MTVLLLNASYEPLRVIPLRRAVGLMLAGKVDAVAEHHDHDHELRTSGGASFEVPAVLRLRRMVRVPFRANVPLTRRAIEARDQRRCQVSGCDRPGRTVDHVIPRSRGGLHEWTNVVMMCPRHNASKGSKLLEELGWSLQRQPLAPRGEVVLLARAGIQDAPPAWMPYLPGLATL